MDKVFLIIGAAIFAVVVAFGIALLMALPTMLIWNYLVISGVTMYIFGIPQLTFWKAFFLNWLCAILFKSSNSNISSK